MQIEIDSFAAALLDGGNDRTPSGAEAMGQLLDRIALTNQVGLDVFGTGEHHRAKFLDSGAAVVLAAVAARTSRIHLTSALTMLNAADSCACCGSLPL